jgi:hypothetical protein
MQRIACVDAGRAPAKVSLINTIEGSPHRAWSGRLEVDDASANADSHRLRSIFRISRPVSESLLMCSARDCATSYSRAL